MRRFLLDSGILSDLINRRYGIRERTQLEIDQGNIIGTGLPILAELAYGIEYGQNRDRNMQSLVNTLPMLKLWPLNNYTAPRKCRIRHTGWFSASSAVKALSVLCGAI